MGRFVFVVLLLAGCPQKAKDAEIEPLGSNQPPPAGRSVTKVDEEIDGGGSGGLRGKLQKMAAEGSDGPIEAPSGRSKTEPKAAPEDAGTKAPTVDAGKKLWGGNGSPPYYDDEGHLHGPGGPVFMGKGPECNAERDHCMREGVWFAVDNLVAGKLYRATPIYEFEKKWYNWRGKEVTFAQRFKTKVATKETVAVGDPIIWFIDENANRKFVDNEYDALTSSRWEAGYVEQLMGEKVRVKGWTYGLVPLDTIRVIVERK